MATALYESQLFNLQNQIDDQRKHYPQIVKFNTNNITFYDIDLETRTIKAPKVLSVEFDHNASVVYFRCARYYQNYDLATSPCIIQYINAANQGGIYWVPFIETNYTLPEDNSILTEGRDTIIIPWVVNGLAAIKSGKITFNIRFFKLQKITIEKIETEEEDDIQYQQLEQEKYQYLYNIETQPAISSIITSLQLKEEDIETFIQNIHTEDIYLQTLTDSMDNATTYWTDL